VLDAAPDGIAVVDGDGGIVLVNAGSISSHAAGTAPTSRGETSLSPLRTAGGPLVTAISRDVTERKLAPAREQHARREAEESVALLETILSAAPVGLAFVDTDLRYVRVNDAMAAMNGLPPSAHVGRTPSELLPALGPEIESLGRRVLETNQPLLRVELEGETPAPGSTRLQWLASYYPVRTPDGRLLGVGSVVENITERQRAEAQREELLAITERARSEAERAIEIVERVQAVTDLPFAHLSLDEALPELLVRIHRMLAVDITVILLLDEQRESLRVHDAVGLDVARACQVAIPLGEGFAGRVAKEQRPIMIEAVTRHDVLNPALLERKVRSLLGVPILSHGRVLGVLHVGACERRHFTEDDGRLLQLVADRLALVIQRGRLYEVEHAARAAAEASLRARAEVERLKDDLTAMVVHDLKSPVTAIAMLTQLARRKGQDLPDSQLRALLQIERTCWEMTRLIQNVLEIGKLEEGKLPVSPAPIVLAELVDEVVIEYGPMAEQTGHRLTAAIGPDLPCVLADRALLKRVLVNLVVNALRHSGSDEVRLEGTRDTAPARLRLQVIDQGHGIAEDDQAHVFEKFASIRRSGAREPSSDTGLGLPFCKLATERMGGEIRLSSHREVGTIFTLVLPSQLVG
jgi:PAS domain S-box-containing protein